MPLQEIERFHESDSSENEESYSKLVNYVSQLDSTQRVKPAQRKEISSEVSEYNLGQGPWTKKNLVNVKELVQVLGKKSGHGVMKEKIRKVTKKARTLSKPLEKPVEERLKRSIGFENVKKQLGKWDAIVTRNALRDSISFPLNDKTMIKQKSNDFLSQFKTKSPLEEEIAKVLKEESERKVETDDNEFPLTLEEMMEKRKEMAQIRAKLSYKQSKAQRQSKIKSKKFHRLLRQEKIKQQLKEFEILQKTDPEAALKKLSELDKTRAKERASLRHKNTGQWAKNLTVRAKYDVETRKILAEQLKMSRELTQKVSTVDSSDDEETKQIQLKINPPTAVSRSPNNPWILDVSTEVQDFLSGYKKFWRENENQEITNDKSNKKEDEDIAKNISENFQTIKNEEMTIISEKAKRSFRSKSKSLSEPGTTSEHNSCKMNSSKDNKTSVTVHPTSGIWIVTPLGNEENKKKKGDDIDKLFDDLNDELMKKATKRIKKIKNQLRKTSKKENKVSERNTRNTTYTEFDLSLTSKNVIERPDIDAGLLEGEVEERTMGNNSGTVSVGDVWSMTPATVDPKNFIHVKPKRLRTQLPESVTGEEDRLDDDKAQEMIIEEAFGEDDVMAEFKKMKEEKEVEESSKVEVETSLPGWGEWGGTGIKPNPKKKRLVVLKRPPKRDKLEKDVILNENENPNLKNHLVKEVPHPFKSVEAFEANIRAPLGRDWVPETAHQKLIQKQVTTKLGTVIEAMNEEEIVRTKKTSKSPYQGMKKRGGEN